VSENIITIRNLHKTYEKPVLSGVDLNIKRGETMVILGGSGSGKSQILKHIIGLIKADSETSDVIVEETNMTTCSKKELLKIRKKMGLVFQAGALFDSMTIYENIAFPIRENFHLPESEIYDRVIKMLKLVDLGRNKKKEDEISSEFLKKMSNELSGGMQKRLALARTVAMKPDVLMYDEPTTGLDPVTSSIIGDLILDMKLKLNVTSVVVTHDMPLAFKIADRIAFLQEGRIKFLGTPIELKNSKDIEIQKFIRGERDIENLQKSIKREQLNETFNINDLTPHFSDSEKIGEKNFSDMLEDYEQE